jgi:hypothetical protein
MYRAGLVDRAGRSFGARSGIYPPLLKTNANFIIFTEYAYKYFTINDLVDIVT